MQAQRTPDTSGRMLKIIWGALVMSVLIYGMIVFMMSRIWAAVPREEQALTSNPMLLALAIAAMASLVMAFFIFPALHARKRDQSTVAIRQRFIVQWALIESVAIYGVVGTFLMQDPRVFVAFVSVSLVAFLLAFPTAERTLSSRA